MTFEPIIDHRISGNDLFNPSIANQSQASTRINKQQQQQQQQKQQQQQQQQQQHQQQQQQQQEQELKEQLQKQQQQLQLYLQQQQVQQQIQQHTQNLLKQQIELQQQQQQQHQQKAKRTQFSDLNSKENLGIFNKLLELGRFEFPQGQGINILSLNCKVKNLLAPLLFILERKPFVKQSRL